jgi:hypothetical protein
MKKTLAFAAAAIVAMGAAIAAMTEANAGACIPSIHGASCIGPGGGAIAGHGPGNGVARRSVTTRRTGAYQQGVLALNRYR